MIRGADIVMEARRWLGVPFQHQGRTKFGVDCVGLVLCVRHALSPWPEGLAETRAYRRRVSTPILKERAEFYGERVQTPAAGVIALIQWPGNADPTHIAILTGSTVIHSYERVGRVVECGYRDPWVKWTHSLYRLPGVAYE